MRAPCEWSADYDINDNNLSRFQWFMLMPMLMLMPVPMRMLMFMLMPILRHNHTGRCVCMCIDQDVLGPTVVPVLRTYNNLALAA